MQQELVVEQPLPPQVGSRRWDCSRLVLVGGCCSDANSEAVVKAVRSTRLLSDDGDKLLDRYEAFKVKS